MLLALARTARAAHYSSWVPFASNVLSDYQADIADLYGRSLVFERGRFNLSLRNGP